MLRHEDLRREAFSALTRDTEATGLFANVQRIGYRR